ncbi:hypothetical protein, partial [Rhizobium lentis]|uniref:hypothetical protein n=1 Tax=Rhizobium lentis TaxID=1138194 RepID=UPI001C837A1A
MIPRWVSQEVGNFPYCGQAPLKRLAKPKENITKIIKAKIAFDLPLNFHPAATRAPAVLNTPSGAVGATGGNAKLSSCAALEPV